MRCENCGTKGVVSRNQAQQIWRFLDTGHADPFFNMALDEAIAVIAEHAEGMPTIRVYGWKPAAVSIGYSQKALAAVNVKKLARLGIPLVRRLTGGRAVFHDQEVTYSVMAPKGQLGAPQSILKTYRHIGQALVASLGHLGVSAHLSRAVSRGSHGVGSALHPCFSSSGRYEVLVGHHKVVGSAQRRIGGVVLQHGSLLTGEGHLRIAQLLPLSDEMKGEKVLQELREKTISLDALLSRRVRYAEVARALFLGFQEVLSSDSIEPGELLTGEKNMARRLVRERYARQEWTLRR